MSIAEPTDSEQAPQSEPSTPSQGSLGEQESLASPPKRKRGRPRKTPTLEVAETHPTPPSSEVETPGGGVLAQKVRRKLNQELRKVGVRNSELPALLRDSVTARSRKGKVGQIVVRSLSGVENSGAAQLARKLENQLSEGRDDVIEKLEASGSNNQSIRAVARILTARPDFSLARAIAEAKADVAVVLDSYAKGALALKKMETVLEIYKQMPHLMRDLMRHAIDEEEACGVCLGVGSVSPRAGARKLGLQCPRCKGTGSAKQSSEHKEFAIQKVLEMSEMLPKKTPMVNVNQAVQVNAGQGADVLTRMSKAADEILYAQSNPVLDAEVVDEQD